MRKGTSRVLVCVAVLLLLLDSTGLYFAFFPPSSPCGQPAYSAMCGVDSSSVTSSNGLRLTVAVNSSVLDEGQEPMITVSILNTLPTTTTVAVSNDLKFEGVPVFLWPACLFGSPMVAVVLKGNHSLQEMPGLADVPFYYLCHEGVLLDHATFQPNSDVVNVTGTYDVTGSRETLGPFYMSTSFTTGGYWDLQALSKDMNAPYLGSAGNPPSYVPFVPGVYAIGVADGWGQAVVLHFTVLSAPPATSTACVITGQPGGFFIRVVNDANETPVAGATVMATDEPATCNGAPATSQGTTTFTTGNTEWHSLDSQNIAAYSFFIVYSGRSYTFTADLRPVSVTCASLYVPSGESNVTTSAFQATCP